MADILGSGDAESVTLNAGDGESISLPEDFPLTDAEFSNNGDDLVLTGPDGEQITVEDYFAQENPPQLTTPDGAEVSGDMVVELSGGAGDEMVSAGTDEAGGGSIVDSENVIAGTDGEPIGTVENISGTVYAVRTDGTRVELEEGDQVFQGDILESGPDGAIGVLLADETTFSMGEEGRMVLDEMIYDPGTQEGSVSLSVLQGVFTFVSGQVAKTDPDAMTLDTPVATIGIRGTQVGIEIPNGEDMQVVLMEEADGFVGEIVIQNDAGAQVLNGANQFSVVRSYDVQPLAAQQITEAQMVENYSQALEHLPLIHGNQNDFGLQRESEEEFLDEEIQQIDGEDELDAAELDNFETAAGEEETSNEPDVVEETEVSVQSGIEFDVIQDIVEGTGGDNIEVQEQEQQETVTVEERDLVVAEVEEIDPLTPVLEFGSVQADTIDGGLGNDVLAGGGGDDDIYGGAGDDKIAGEGDDDSLHGDEGDDSISGGSGNDIIEGGSGSDFVQGGGGADYIDGGTGDDVLVGGTVEDGVSEVTVTVDEETNEETITLHNTEENTTTELVDDSEPGASGATEGDTIIGGEGDDVILGMAGDDILDGGTGDDIIHGGSGDDQVTGGEGDDLVFGGLNDDDLSGGTGDDVVFGGSGDDDVAGDEGEDKLFGGTGNDALDGGAGNDVLDGGSGSDELSGGAGGDVIDGGLGNDVVAGGAGGDNVDGGFGDDVIVGGDIEDGFTVNVADDGTVQLVSDDGTETKDYVEDTSDGADALAGGSGDDTIVGGAGNDAIDGGTGNDVLHGGSGDDDIQGGLGNDALFGGEGDDVLEGGVGADVIEGGAGDDTIILRDSDESIDGGADTDTIQLAGDIADADVMINLGSGEVSFSVESDGQTAQYSTNVTSIENVVAGGGDDVIIGSDADNVITGGAGDDIIDGAGGFDTAAFDGDFADAAITFDAEGNITLTGDDGTDVISNVELFQFAGDDVIAAPITEDASFTLSDGRLFDNIGDADTITISGLPDGAELSAGTDNGDGTWTLTATETESLADILAGVEVSPNSSTDFVINVEGTKTVETVTIGENDEEIIETSVESTGSGELQMVVGGVIDFSLGEFAPEGMAGLEDQPIDLNVNFDMGDMDGSETLSITVSGVPQGPGFDGPGGESLDASMHAVFTDQYGAEQELVITPNFNGDFIIDDSLNQPDGFTSAQMDEVLSSLTVTPPFNHDEDFDLTFQVAVTEDDGATQTMVSSTSVAVEAVADAPLLEVNNTDDAITFNILEDERIALDINPTQTDPSEVLSITIDGLPDGTTIEIKVGEDYIELPVADGSVVIPTDHMDSVFVTPPEDSNEDFDLTVNATSTEPKNDDSATTSLTVSVGITGVVDDFELDASLANVIPTTDGEIINEAGDVQYDVDIVTALGDSDFAAGRTESETMSISINILDQYGDPMTDDIASTIVLEGGAVVDPTNPSVWTISGETEADLQQILADLTLTVGGSVSTDFKLEVTATVTDSEVAEDGSMIAIPKSQTEIIDVEVANDPILGTHTAEGFEDIAMPLDLFATLEDTEGETLSMTITDIPEGAILTSGDTVLEVVDGQISFSQEDINNGVLEGLHIQAPANSSDDFNLTVTATSTTDVGDIAEVTHDVPVLITGVADEANLDIDDVTGDAGDAIPLSIDLGEDVSLNDTDGSETLSITIENIPEGAVLMSGENVLTPVDGVITMTPEQLTGLTITPSEDQLDNFTLMVRAHTTEADGDTSTVSEVLNVTLDQGAEAPTVTLGDSQGVEDSAIALNIDIAPEDLGETLSVTISGIPAGAVLSAGVLNADGTVSFTDQMISDGALANLSITPPSDSNVDFDLTVAVTSNDDGDTVTVTDTLSVDVIGVADAPDLVTNDVTGSENTAIDLDLSSSLNDTDGSESLSITISNIPEGAVLSAGTVNFDGTVTLSPEQLTGLTITPALNSEDDFSLQVTATSTEDDGDTSSVSGVFNVDIVGGADAPTVTIGAAEGFEDTAIPLNIDIDPTDVTETLSVTISGIPAGATLSAGTLNPDGTVSFTNEEIEAGVLADLSITAPADSNVDFDLEVAVTSTDGDDQVTVNETLSVDVVGVADGPNLTTADAAGVENEAIDLDLTSTLNDVDGSESLSITISNIPEGASLSAGTVNTDGSVTLTPVQLVGLQVTPPVDSEQEFALHVTATSTENDGDSASVSGVINVDITGGADAPTLVLDDASGLEDGQIALSIQSQLSDVDETLSITISDIPEGAVLTSGGIEIDISANGIANLLPAQLDGLTITPPADSNEDFDLTVTATSTTEGGEFADTTATLNVEVAGVADTPTLQTADASGVEDNAIALDISSAVTDTDGSETLSITISGVPQGASLNGGTDNGNGVWVLDAADLDGLTITPPEDFNGEFDLAIAATSTDTEAAGEPQHTDSTTVNGSLTVVVADGAEPPVLVLDDAAGNEDTPIDLEIDASAADGSELLSITISDIPAGSTLSAGTTNPDGTVTLTPEQLDGLTITPPGDSNVDFDLTVTATAQDGNDIFSTTDTMAVDVVGVADAPTLSASLGQGVVQEEDPGSTSITMTNEGQIQAGYDSSYGYYITNENGEPVEGGIVWADIKQGVGETQDIDLGDVDPANIGFFMIPNGDNENSGLTDGMSITFAQDEQGHWQAVGPDGTALEGTGADIFFSDQNLNSDDYDHMEDTDGIGNQNWEDLVYGGDQDYTDGNFTAHITTEPGVPGEIAYPLDISSALTDTDGSETLSITVANLPVDGVLSAGTVNADGSVTLTAAELDGLTLTVPNGTGGFDLNISASSTENDGDVAVVDVTVDGTAQDPDLSVSAATGDEDTAIALDIDAALTDSDGSETLSITISDIPDGATLSAGVVNDDGSVTLTSAELEGLEITPPENSNVDFDLTVTTTSTQTNTGDTAVNTATLSVDVVGVADAPGASAQDETGSEDNWIQLNLDSEVSADTDGSETLSIVISDVPDGARLNPGTENDDGTWSVSQAELPTVCILPPDDFSGEIAMTLSVTTTENDGDSVTTDVPFTVSVEAVADAPDLDVTAAAGDEDTAIDLDISAAVTDASETLSITISDIPDGAVLSAGTLNQDGSVTLSTDELTGLQITPAADSNDDFNLTVTATSQDGSDTATSVSSLAVDVTGVADTPSLEVSVGDATTSSGSAEVDGVDITGGSGEDFIAGGAGDDTISTGGEEDWVAAGAGDDVIDGGSGDDRIFAGDGDDVVEGGSGKDFLSGGAGNDVLNGGADSDTFLIGVGGGNDSIDGGTGSKDTIVITNEDGTVADPSEWTVELSQGTFEQGSDRMEFSSDAVGTITLADGSVTSFQNVERIDWSGSGPYGGNETVTVADEVGGTINGDGDEERIIGSEGDDVINAGSDEDAVDAGGGDDIVSGGNDEDLLIGGEGDDQLDGGGHNDMLVGGAGDDIIEGGEGGDTAAFSGSRDQYVVTQNDDGSFSVADRVEGRDGTDTVSGVEKFVFAGEVVDENDLLSTNPDDTSPIGDTTTFDLNVASTLSDTDGSETLSITVSGLPEGGVLSAGTINDDGSVTLSPDELADLSISVPNSTAGFNLDFASTATENDGDTATVSTSVYVPPADAGADTPDLVVSAAAGDEDTAIALDIDAALTDTDGSETLSITVSDIPDGATLSAGTVNPDGTVTLTSDQLDGLTVTPAENSNVDFDLTVTATSTETSTGDTATQTATLNVDVVGVADTPSATAQDETGSEDQWLQLNLDSQVSADTDGSETLSIVISGVPDGALLSPGSDNNDGTWSVSPAQLPSVCILPPDDFSGEMAMTLSVTSSENDGDTATTDVPFTVTIDGVADTPTVSFTAAEGVEDTAIDLDISAAVTDDSETLSITVSDIPDGATLSAGTVNQDGSVTLTGDELVGLQITPPSDSNVDFDLTVTTTSTDGDDTATNVSTVPVAVTGVADAPTLSVELGDGEVVSGGDPDDVTIDMDNVTEAGNGFSVSARSITDQGELSDASADNISIQSSNPPGFGVSGSASGASSELGFDNESGLSEQMIVDFDNDVSSADVAFAWKHAGEDAVYELYKDGVKVGEGTVVGGSDGVDPAVTLSAESGSTFDQIVFTAPGSDDDYLINSISFEAPGDDPAMEYPLDISSSLADTDGSETLSISVNNLPDGVTLSAGTVNVDGSVSLTPAELVGLTMTVPDNSADFDLSVSATSTENDGDTSTVTSTVSVSGDIPLQPPSLEVTLGDPVVTEIPGEPGETRSVFSSSFDGANATFVDSIDGWDTDSDAIETWTNSYGHSGDGGYVELNDDNKDHYDDATDINRSFDTVEGATYSLTFQYSPRAGYDADVNAFDVKVDGAVVESLSADGSNNSDNVWQSHTVTFTGTGEPMNLEFMSTGTAMDYGRGMRLDDIVLDETLPDGEPTSTFDYPLDISASLSGTDDTESLSITVNGLPDGALLSAGTDNGDGSWTLTNDQLDGLSMSATDQVEDFNLNVSATSSNDDGESATAARVVPVDVTADGFTGGGETLEGSDGIDALFGSDGDDVIIGAAGDDVLSGGDGQDSFVFDSESGHDIVTDLLEQDTLVFEGQEFNMDDLILSENDEGDVVVSFQGVDNASVTLEGISKDDLDANQDGDSSDGYSVTENDGAVTVTIDSVG
jgi:Ca2+-binding RTX toxin-like protein